MLNRWIKRMKDRASRGKVELLLTNLLKGGHILHDQYNTRHAVPAIPDEIRGEIRREPSKSKIQQKPVIYLLLAGPLGWQCGVPGLPVPTSPQPSQSAHWGGTETDPGYAPQESNARHGGAVASLKAARLHPSSGKIVPGYAETGNVPSEKPKNSYKPKPYEQMTYASMKATSSFAISSVACLP